MRSRALALLACWASAALAVAALVLLGGATWQAHQAGLSRRSGRAARIRTFLRVDPEDTPALSAAVARFGQLEPRTEVPWLRVSGSPYARGFAHGFLLQERVRSQILGLLDRSAAAASAQAARYYTDSQDPGLLVQALGLALGAPGLAPLARDGFLDEVDAPLQRHLPPRFREEMLGLADGAELDPQDVHRFHAIAEVASAGCSNLAAWGRATRGGRFLQFRNLDWPLRMRVQDHPLLLEQAPGAGTLGHLSVGFVGFLGALQGVSAAGITLGEVGAGSRLVSYDGQPMVFRMRRLLEEAWQLKDAERILREANRTKGYNFVIGHLPTRRALAFETNRERVARFAADDPAEQGVFYARPHPDAILRADVAVDPRVRSQQQAARGPGDPATSHSYRHRYAAVADGVAAAKGALDLEGLTRIARQAGNASQNLVSVLYTEETLYFAFAKGKRKASQRAYEELAYTQVPALEGLAQRMGSRDSNP